MQLEPAAYQRLLALLDQALDWPEAEHERRLAALSAEDADLRPHLARLLARQKSVKDGDAALLDQGVGAFFAADAAVSAVHQPGEVVAHYVLERILGRGGMGIVWLARRVGHADHPRVALKLPALQQLAPGIADRMAREGAILAALNHPNIARLVEAGVSGAGAPFLAMEYVDGETLPVHCNARKLGTAARLQLFLSVLDAVASAHAALVLHRDLKPGNVLVTPAGQVKLLDFGIAKLIDDSGRAGSTRLTQVAGRALTPDYASPEQISGASLTVASDVYSLGVMLFELLTGARPYRLKRGSAAELEEAILSADTSRPSTVVNEEFARLSDTTLPAIRKRLAGDLDTIILKALKKNPDERYHSVLDLKDDIDRHLRGMPVLARPDSPAYIAGKFIRRNRLAVGAACAVLLALILGLVASLWQAGIAREQAHIAAEEAARATAIKQFLTGLFERNTRLQINAVTARNMSVRDVLIESGEKIDKAFGNDKLLREELARTIGGLLVDVEEPARGAKLIAESVALMEARGATQGDNYFDALAMLINALRLEGRGKEALAVRDKALRAIDARGDKDSLVRARILSASVQQFATDHEREVKLLEESLQIFRSRFPDHPGHATAAFALANTYRVRGHWQSSTPLFAEAVEVFDKTASKDVMLVAQAHFWRGYGESQMGRPGQALRHIERGIALAEQHAGAKSPAVIFLRSLYGRTLHRAGRRTEAHAEFSRLRGPAALRKQSPNDFNLALYQGEAHLAEGDPARAIAVLSEYENSLATHGNRFFPNAVSWVTTLALAHAARGDFAASDRIMTRMKDVTALYSLDAPYLDAYRYDVSGIHLLRGQPDEAMQVWRYKLFIGDITFKVFFDSGAQVWLRLAEAKLIAAEQPGSAKADVHAEALKDSERVLAFINKFTSLDEMPYLAAYALAVNGRALKANGRLDEGDAQLKRAIALMRDHHAPGSVWLKGTQKALAN